MKRYSLIFVLFGLAIFAQAQKLYTPICRVEPKNLLLEKQLNNSFKGDSLFVKRNNNEILLKCYQSAFLSAFIQNEIWQNDTVFISVRTGPAFELKELRMGNVPQEWQHIANFNFVSNKPNLINPKQLFIALNQLIIHAENNGFPFATVTLDSLEADSNGMRAAINLQKNQLVFFDSIDFGGTANIQKIFLQNYANIKPGAPYQEELLKNLDARLSELAYLQVAQPLGVYFYGNKAKPYVYINKRKASSFDGVIGFAPNSSINNKLVLTGDLNLKLVNILGSGKNFELAYRGFLNNSQDLQLKMNWPYFLNSKLGIDYAFKLMKFDTTWLELYNDIGLQYRFTGNNYIKIYLQLQSVQVLNPDTHFVALNKKLPLVNDVKNNIYGLAIRKATLDYFFNPQKGYLIELEAGAGTKQIVKNASISEVALLNNGNKYAIYDSVKLMSLQYKCQGNLMLFTKVASHFVLLTQAKGAIIANENLFLNELFRIGGLKTLKGFDEQSIFANKFIIANLELRYLFQQNSSFLVFWNGAYYKNEVNNPQVTDKPWGIGAGMNIETGAGIFSLYYAMGSQKGNSLEVQSAKIHFGFVSFF